MAETMPATTLPNRPNFRSLAGLPATDGRRVRENVLYRSESLADLSEDDQIALEKLNIRSVCDLRSDGERTAHPLIWPGEQPQLVPVETLPDARVAGPELIGRIMSDVEGDTLAEILTGNAEDMPGAFVNSMKIVFDSIVDDERLPLLVKCVAGKDRTGFVIANILKAVDVHWDAIVDDYLASGRNIDKERLHQSMMEYVEDPSAEVLSPERLVEVGSREAYLKASFDAIDRDFGSYDSYLENICGLTPTRRDRLKDLLLE